MTAVFPITEKTAAQTADLLLWLKMMGGNLKDRAMLLVKPTLPVEALLPCIRAATKAFSASKIIYEVSEIERGEKWLECKPDLTPLKPDWLSLEANESGKLRDSERVQKPANGFPVTFAMHTTHKTPRNVMSPGMLDRQASVFKGCADGSLIKVLRHKRFPLSRENEPRVFMLTGCYGDLFCLLPAFKDIQERTGKNPLIIVSYVYAPIFDGISYADPLVMQRRNSALLVPVFYEDYRIQYPYALIVQCGLAGAISDHAVGPPAKNYQEAMWQRLGMLDRMKELPLVLDKRDRDREANLRRWVFKTKKPKLLFNFLGVTSPCRSCNPVAELLQSYGHKFELVDLAAIRAPRIHDILGLMDHAVGMVTIDTYSLHLAKASKMPYIALLRDLGDGGESVPMGNVVLSMSYREGKSRLAEIEAVLKQWLENVETKEP